MTTALCESRSPCILSDEIADAFPQLDRESLRYYCAGLADHPGAHWADDGSRILRQWDDAESEWISAPPWSDVPA